MRYSKEKIKELTGIEIKTDFGYIEVLDEKQYKSNQQNRTWHTLLQTFWLSGCSSFNSYDEMRDHYKKVANLIEYQFESVLSAQAKQILWKAIKLLPLNKNDYNELIRLLQGQVKIIHSWADVEKEWATTSINQLINDMDEAGVIGSKMGNKYEQILIGMGDWYEDSK